MRTSGWAVVVLAGVLGGGVGLGQEPTRPPLHIGGDVKHPTVVFSEEPRLSEADMKLYRYSNRGAQIYLWVDENGLPSHVRVMRSTGIPGVDAACVTAVKNYRFKPATLDGKPVTVDLYIDVNIDTF